MYNINKNENLFERDIGNGSDVKLGVFGSGSKYRILSDLNILLISVANIMFFMFCGVLFNNKPQNFNFSWKIKYRLKSYKSYIRNVFKKAVSIAMMCVMVLTNMGHIDIAWSAVGLGDYFTIDSFTCSASVHYYSDGTGRVSLNGSITVTGTSRARPNGTRVRLAPWCQKHNNGELGSYDYITSFDVMPGETVSKSFSGSYNAFDNTKIIGPSANGCWYVNEYNGKMSIAIYEDYDGYGNHNTRVDVRDCNVSGISNPPSAPSSISVSGTNTYYSSTISWSSVSGATSYIVEYNTGSGWRSLYTGPSTSTTKYFSGSSVQVRVKAENSDGESSWTTSSTYSLSYTTCPFYIYTYIYIL